MCNAIDVLKTLAIGAIAATAACSNGSSGDAAADLAAQARQCIDQGNFTEALALIDSIDKAYPEQTDIRRSAMPMKAEAQLGEMENKLFTTNNLIDQYQEEYDRLMPKFTHVDGTGTGYFIQKGAYGANITESTAVQARINSGDGSFCITASNAGDKIGITEVTLHGENGSMSTLPLSDSHRAGDSDKYGTDLASFAPSECDSLGSWAYHSAGRISSATISGVKGSKEIKFNQAQGEQFANAWRLGLVSLKLKDAKALRDKLERQILVARDHIEHASEKK